MNKEYIIKKSNFFIMNSSYDLSLEEQKIILTLASMVQPTDEEFKPYILSIAEFMKLLGVENQSKYTEIPKITKELMKKVFEIKEDDKLIQVAWLSSVMYQKGTGQVELEFSPKLKPYMLKLNSMFTQYKLVNILTMKSKYSPRIYELLKCNEFKKQGYIEVEVADLRHLLKAENIYPLYADFKKKVILQSQKELKEMTDISFEFDEIKTGRKVTSIKFYIRANSVIPEVQRKNENESATDEVAATKESPATDIDDLVDIVRSLISEPLKTKDLKAILAQADNNIDVIKEKYYLAKNQGGIEDLTAWLIAAIKKDYSPSESLVRKIKQNKFVNYEQRTWDFDKLEKLEREYIDKNLEKF